MLTFVTPSKNHIQTKMTHLFLSTMLSGIFSIITIIPVENIAFTNKYDETKATIIPAAFTTEYGEILGKYCINGIEYGEKWIKEYTSIHPTKGLIIDFGKWHASNGFQQYVLVKNNKARPFKDPKKRLRRALCNDSKNPSALFIIESKIPMTMTEFAATIQPYCLNAVNLDTGDYAFCKINNKHRSRWAVYNKHKQTNWIVGD